MVDAGIRARVVRFLNGDFVPEDLARIFLFARDRCDGREPVQEIGDFVAHKAERNKGIVTREVRDWALIAFFMSFFNRHPPGANPYITNRSLPSQFVPWLHATLRRAPPRLRKFPMAKAKKLVETIEQKIVRTNFGTISVERLNAEELDYIDKLTRSFVVRPAFTSDRLFTDLKATLRSSGVLEPKESNAFDQQKRLTELFAVTLMHGCAVDLGDGLNTTLMASDPINGGPISVDAGIPVPNPGGVPLAIATAMYKTELSPQGNMEEDLINAPQPWAFELELRPNGLLCRLG
jgi:hypothetical protein